MLNYPCILLTDVGDIYAYGLWSPEISYQKSNKKFEQGIIEDPSSMQIVLKLFVYLSFLIVFLKLKRNEK